MQRDCLRDLEADELLTDSTTKRSGRWGFRLGVCVSWGGRLSNTWPRVRIVVISVSELQADIFFDLYNVHPSLSQASKRLPQEVGNNSLCGL